MTGMRILLAACAVVGLSGCALIGPLYQMAAGSVKALNAGDAASWKLMTSCLPAGTAVDTPAGPVAVESLRAGDVVVGFEGEPVRVMHKHEYVEQAAGERFLRVSFENGAVVDLCDQHRIGGVRAGELSPGDVAGGHRVVAVERYGGVTRSYDLLTEDAGYRIGGVAVNSMINEMMTDMGRQMARGGRPEQY